MVQKMLPLIQIFLLVVTAVCLTGLLFQNSFIEGERLRIASSALGNVVTFFNTFLGKTNICCNGYEYVSWIDLYR